MVEATLAFVKILNIKNTFCWYPCLLSPNGSLFVQRTLQGCHFDTVSIQIIVPGLNCFLFFLVSSLNTSLLVSAKLLNHSLGAGKKLGTLISILTMNYLIKSSEMPCYVYICMSQYARYCYRYYFTWGSAVLIQTGWPMLSSSYIRKEC